MLPSLNKREARRRENEQRWMLHSKEIWESDSRRLESPRSAEGSFAPTNLSFCGNKMIWLSVPTSLRKGIGLPCQLPADSFMHVLLGKPVRGGQGLNEDSGWHLHYWELGAPKWAGRFHSSQAGGLYLGFVIRNLDGEKNYIFNFPLPLAEISHFLQLWMQATNCDRIRSTWDFIPSKSTDSCISHHTCAGITKYHFCAPWLPIRLAISPTARTYDLTH